MDAAREVALQTQRAPSGTLRMTASTAFSHICIVPHLGAFHERYPEVSVELLPTDATLDIAANAIDLAVRLGPAPEGDLISTRILTTRSVVCAAPDYLARHAPIQSPDDLAHHNCLRLAMPGFRTRWRFRQRGSATVTEVPVSGRTIIANALSLRRATLDGLGPALLADWVVKDDLATGRLINLFPDHDATATEFETGAFALYPSRAFLPRKVRAMIDFLRERAKV